MKKLFFLMLAVCSIALTSCSGEEEDIAPAQFSATELQFTAKGETQTVKLLNYDKVVLMNAENPELDKKNNQVYNSRYENDWLAATVFNDNLKEISITVAENTTGKKRTFKLPVYTHNIDKNTQKGTEKPHSGQTSYITITQESK